MRRGDGIGFGNPEGMVLLWKKGIRRKKTPKG